MGKKVPRIQPLSTPDTGTPTGSEPGHDAETKSSPASKSFSIVGIGASAGGLEALELFLKNVPPDCGLGFVVVHHLDPDQKSLLAGILQHVTDMQVVQITDRMPVEPGRVHVIPPNYDLSILKGRLHLLEPTAHHGIRLPIDSFLRSLADDQEELAVGVILSGMGSDGTLGLRAIKEKSGSVFIQDPASAKFDDMPQSAIGAGLADVVASAEALPRLILDYIQHVPFLIERTAVDLADADQSGLEKVMLILRAQTGHDFSLYKKNTLYRRIERRMGLHQLGKIADYVKYLRENSKEAELLFKELLIGVTSFFRDPEVWEQLKAEVIPVLLSARPSGGIMRAWTVGCSTGEEAYSLAIVFREALERVNPDVHYSLQIFATDLDYDAIDKARAGLYSANIVADVSLSRLNRYFMEDEQGYRVRKEIREMVIFAPQNLVMDAPFTKLDLLTCRNLLIYLDVELQKRILPLFHYSLNPGGCLVLGSSESVGTSTNLFFPLLGKTRLFNRRESVYSEPVVFPSSFSRVRSNLAATLPPWHEVPPVLPNVQAIIEALLFLRFSPAAVLCTERGDITYVSGKTGKYLEPAAGKANMNVFAMAREGLGGALEKAFATASLKESEVTIPGLHVGTNDGIQVVDVTVMRLAEPANLQGMMLVVFSDVAASPIPKDLGGPLDPRTYDLEEELKRSRAELQATREEMQTSEEELKSINEEFQSTNEELQSTNEELTTSKEEMQSMNEELHSVNNELLSKVDELLRSSDDMKNLLNSTNIATLFLDSDLRVRRFTKQAAGIIKLIPVDIGRSITDLVTTMDYVEMEDDARKVLETLVYCERQIAVSDGRWLSVRIMPYRTGDNRIDGLVITFIDISTPKALELTVREALSLLQSRFDKTNADLDASLALEDVLQKAQGVLEARLAAQTIELRQVQEDSLKEKGGKN